METPNSTCGCPDKPGSLCPCKGNESTMGSTSSFVSPPAAIAPERPTSVPEQPLATRFVPYSQTSQMRPLTFRTTARQVQQAVTSVPARPAGLANQAVRPIPVRSLTAIRGQIAARPTQARSAVSASLSAAPLAATYLAGRVQEQIRNAAVPVAGALGAFPAREQAGNFSLAQPSSPPQQAVPDAPGMSVPEPCSVPGTKYSCCCAGGPPRCGGVSTPPAGASPAAQRAAPAARPPATPAAPPAMPAVPAGGTAPSSGKPRTIPGSPGAQRLVDPNKPERTGWWFPGFMASGNPTEGGPLDLRGGRVGEWSRAGMWIGYGAPPWSTGYDGSGWIGEQIPG